VDSILDTNFEEGDEIVIVDDKSTDNTLEIIEKLSFKNPSVKIIKHLSNQGGGATRNTAVKNSKNDLIFCLDSDNVLEKNSIGKLKSFLVSNKSDVASFGRLKFFKENTKKITHQWKFKDGLISMPDIFCSPIIPSSSGNYLFTKKSWVDADGYPEKSGALDTWGFGFRQLANDAKMITMPNSYYFHRHGHDSYWIRESRNGKISLIATEIIKPYFNLIDKDILSYIKNNPNKWFDNLGNIPNTNCINTGKVILSYKEIIGNKLKRFSYVVSVFKRIFIKINSFIKNLLKEEKEDLQQKRAFPWFNTNGDKTLRLNYPLTSSSVVVDVGGYEGQWASDIFSKYCCNIIIFEPVKEFYVKIKDRFIKNDKIVVYELGLAGSDRDIKISLLNDSSSLFKNDSKSEDIKVVSASSFFNKHNINNIDLIKINIEGSEYDLLENLIKSNFITKIKNIQVQFHDFVPGAKERMIKIQEQLGKTHHLTYQYEFIWENWERNN
jgi:FkbM family methyltransferase